MNIREFIQEANKKNNRCSYCRSEELSQAVADFLDMKRDGETHLSMNFIFQNYLVPKLGAPKTWSSLVSHIRNCLKRDHLTGDVLSDG
jgi:hypothetical protein